MGIPYISVLKPGSNRIRIRIEAGFDELGLSINTFVFQDNRGATIATCKRPAKRTMSKRKSYDVSMFKAIECAEKTSKEAAARKMGVGAKQIREWCTMLSFLTESGTRKPRLTAMLLP